MLFIDVIFMDQGGDFTVKIVNIQDNYEKECEKYTDWKDKELIEERV